MCVCAHRAPADLCRRNAEEDRREARHAKRLELAAQRQRGVHVSQHHQLERTAREPPLEAPVEEVRRRVVGSEEKHQLRRPLLRVYEREQLARLQRPLLGTGGLEPGLLQETGTKGTQRVLRERNRHLGYTAGTCLRASTKPATVVAPCKDTLANPSALITHSARTHTSHTQHARASTRTPQAQTQTQTHTHLHTCTRAHTARTREHTRHKHRHVRARADTHKCNRIHTHGCTRARTHTQCTP